MRAHEDIATIALSLNHIWAEVLGIHPQIIKDNSNFIHLGGNSLHFLSLQLLIQKELQIIVSQEELFGHMDMSLLIKLLAEKKHNER